LALSAAGRKLSRVAGGPAPATREQILVDAATIQTLAEYWTRVRLRPPTCEELRGLVDDHVRRSASSMTTAEFIPGKVGDQSRKRNRHEHEQDADAACAASAPTAMSAGTAGSGTSICSAAARAGRMMTP